MISTLCKELGCKIYSLSLDNSYQTALQAYNPMYTQEKGRHLVWRGCPSFPFRLTDPGRKGGERNLKLSTSNPQHLKSLKNTTQVNSLIVTYTIHSCMYLSKFRAARYERTRFQGTSVPDWPRRCVPQLFVSEIIHRTIDFKETAVLPSNGTLE